MSPEVDEHPVVQYIVQESLDEVDRSRRRAIIVIAVLFAAVLFALGSLLASARIDDGGRTKLLFASTAAQMVFVGLCAALVAFHVTRMTKSILRAIELAKK